MFKNVYFKFFFVPGERPWTFNGVLENDWLFKRYCFSVLTSTHSLRGSHRIHLDISDYVNENKKKCIDGFSRQIKSSITCLAAKFINTYFGHKNVKYFCFFIYRQLTRRIQLIPATFPSIHFTERPIGCLMTE